MNALNVIEEAESIKVSLERSIPPDIRRRMAEAGLGLTLGSTSASALHVSLGPTPAIVAVDYDQLAEEELLEEMASFVTDVTGIDNTVFLSPKGKTRHSARIKVAIDPPDSLNPSAKTAAIVVHDGAVIGEQVPPDLYKRLLKFIELNREAIVDYWDYKIDTGRLKELLVPVPDKF